jgi:hypothetical protein
MTTFTIQDLTNGLPTTPEEDEAFKQMENIGLKEMFADMGKDLTAQHAPVPQPTLCESTQTSQVNPEAVIEHMVAQFSTNLRLLLTTIITQPKAQPETTPPEGANLQDCVEQVLQQAVWFAKMVEEQVESRVEFEVESYFERQFDPTDHFDFGDAISNEVHDRIDDAVRDHIDEAVADKIEEVVAEKLESASVSISF